MDKLIQPETVKEQYADDANLSVRARLHQTYSTNKQGFVPWLFERYCFSEGFSILKLAVETVRNGKKTFRNCHPDAS
ncbi:MAG: hypothetical protein QM689_12240 [Oscillospiraceae bacterium]